MWLSLSCRILTLVSFISNANAQLDVVLEDSNDAPPFDWKLIPARKHGQLDTLDFRHLQPSKSIELFYDARDDPSVFAQGTQDQIFDTVVLDHSAYIQHVLCSADGGIEIIFDSLRAVSVAREWPVNDFVLITSHPTCVPNGDERGVFMVNGPWEWTEDTPLRIKTAIQRKSWEQVTDTMELQYGVRSNNDFEKALELRKRSSEQSCSVTRKHKRACGGASCHKQGVVSSPQILWRIPSDYSKVTCAKACLADAACASFVYQEKSGLCSAYGESVKSLGFQKEECEQLLYDKECWEATPECGFSTFSISPASASASSSPNGYGGSASPATSSAGSNTWTSHSQFASVATSASAHSAPSTHSSRSTLITSTLSVDRALSSSAAPSLSLSANLSPSSSVAGHSESSSQSRSGSLVFSSSSSQSHSESALILSSSSAISESFHSSSAHVTSSTASASSSSAILSESSSSSAAASESSFSSTSSIASTSSDLHVSSSSTSSAPSSQRTLNDYELYLYSLLYNGTVDTPEGNILADLGPNGTYSPQLVTNPVNIRDTIEQARLRQIGIDDGLPTDEECFADGEAGLALAVEKIWAGTPANIIETLPDMMELSPYHGGGNTKRSLPPSTVVLTGHRHEKRFFGTIFNMLIGSLINAIVEPILEAICKPCSMVYNFYTKITDPLAIISEVCVPCRPVLDIVQTMTDPFSYAQNVVDWFNTYGRYDPMGVHTPPPLPPIPPPIEASNHISGSIDIALPVRENFQERSFPGDPEPDVIWCEECSAKIPSIDMFGRVVVNMRAKRVQSAVFDINMAASTYKTSLRLRTKMRQSYWGSLSAGSKYLGSVSVSDVFNVDLDYTHTIVYSVQCSGPTDVTFGLDTSTTAGSARVDLGSGALSSQTGWRSNYNIRYPDLGFTQSFKGDLTVQGLLNMKINIMGGQHKQSGVITNEQNILIRSTVVTPADKIYRDIKCPVGQTQVDSRLKANTALVGRWIDGTDYVFGYRCLQLKTYLEQINAPPQPYCGGLSRGDYVYPGPNPQKATYNIGCSSRPTDGVLLDEQVTNITTFAECIDACHIRDDCKWVSWDQRKYALNCLLFNDQGNFNYDASFFNSWAIKTVPPPPPPPPVSSSAPPTPVSSNPVPTLPSRTSRPPLMFTTLSPPFMPDFTPPAGAPAPPIPADYPHRNPGGYCAGLVDGGHTVGDVPFEVEYDIECGTTIDYTGIMLTANQHIGFDDCLIMCRYYGSDCQAVMMTPEWQGCVILTDWTVQRYTTNEQVALAIKVKNGSGLRRRDNPFINERGENPYIGKWGQN